MLESRYTVILEKQLAAIRFMVDIFETNEISYQITGGLAGNIYGSKWPLHDIDFEVSRDGIERLSSLSSIQAYLISPLHDYQDAEFKMRMMQLEIDGVAIDINQSEDIQLYSEGQWIQWNTDLIKAQRITWRGLTLMVQPLKDIIEYKTLLGRYCDLADLKEQNEFIA